MSTVKIRTLWMMAAAAALLVGLALGVLLGVNGLGVSMPARAGDNSVPVQDVTHVINSNGQTVGHIGDDAKTYDDMPDLIEAFGDDGTVGYVRRDDLGLAPATSLSEIRAANELAATVFQVPLYEKDGTTVIGTFTVNDGASATER